MNVTGPGIGGGFFHSLPPLFIIFFLFIIGIFVFRAVTGIKQWQYNNQQPVLTVDAKITSKRKKVTHHNHSTGNGGTTHTTSRSYYVTFEVESGDRMELKVHQSDYSLLAEGDFGKLTFQGTRFKGFERSI